MHSNISDKIDNNIAKSIVDYYNKTENVLFISNIKNNKNKGNIKLKMNPPHNDIKDNSNNVPSPMQSLFKNENNNNFQFNNSNISANNESNVIANILEINEVNNELCKSINFKNSIYNNKCCSKDSLTIKNDYCQIGDFSFINISKTVIPFLYQYQEYIKQKIEMLVIKYLINCAIILFFWIIRL